MPDGGRCAKAEDFKPPPPAPRARAPARTTLYRDRFGTPYALGETDAAALFAFGYAQAEDHALEIPFLALQVEGRLAEFLGPDCLKSDMRLRTLGFARDAKTALRNLPAKVQDDVLVPFAAGINAAIGAQTALPDWVTAAGPIGPERLVAIALFYGFALSMANDPHSYGAFVAVAPWRDDSGPKTTQAMGSNALAIAGARTLSGSPMVGAIPHLALRHPFHLVEGGIKGDGIDVHGFTFLGLPLPIFGFTSGVAWGVTIDYVDAFDRIFEVVREGPEPAVLRPEGWRPLDMRREIVKVKGASDAAIVIRENDRGPIILDLKPGRAIALDWSGRADARLLSQLVAMAWATDLAAFENALKILGTPNYAYVAADRHGRLLYAHLGQAPGRASTFIAPGGPAPCPTLSVDTILDQAIPVPPCFGEALLGIPGWAADGARRNLVPYDALPIERDPAAGWTQTANTPPSFHSRESRLAACPGESIAPCRDKSIYKMNDRGRRLSASADAMTKATLGDLENLFFDGYATAADRLLPELFAAWERAGPGLSPGEFTRLAPAVDLMRSWDRKSWARSEAAALFSAYAHAAGVDLAVDERQRLHALGIALDHIRRHFGRIDPPWSEVNRLRREPSALRKGQPVEIGTAGMQQGFGAVHALDGGAPPYLGTLAGQNIRLNPAHPGREFPIFGTAAGMVVELLPTGPRGRTALTFGASDDPASPHFADQMRDLLSKGNLKDVPFARTEIEKTALRRTEFLP